MSTEPNEQEPVSYPAAANPPGEERLMDHEYDGIREFDNPTPGWWTMLFVGTFFFSALYFVFFTFSPTAWSIWDQYDSSVSRDLKKRFGEIGDLKPDAATMLEYMKKPEWLLVGQSVFQGNCVQCHGANGSGLIGPNLTDDYYKNVKTIDDIAKVITNGAANGAMPAWANRLHPNEIVLTAAYVATLRGKDLPSPRPAEGEKIAPWPTETSGE